jgi:hypothetical protein
MRLADFTGAHIRVIAIRLDASSAQQQHGVRSVSLR